MKKPTPPKPKRGAPFKGDKPRQRYNVTLNPDLVEAAKKLAESSGISFSEVVENGLIQQLK